MKFGYQRLYNDVQLVEAVNNPTTQVICPVAGISIAEVLKADKNDTLRALDVEQKGFKYWSKLSLAEDIVKNRISIAN